MMTPASDGPTSRAALNIDEFSAIALPRSSLFSIIVMRNAWRPGMSNAFTSPWTTLRPMTSGIVIRPDKVSQASTNDCSIDTVCVATSSRWRFHRST